LTINRPNVAHPTGPCTIITHAVAATCQVLELSSKWEKAPIYHFFLFKKRRNKYKEYKSGPNCMQLKVMQHFLDCPGCNYITSTWTSMQECTLHASRPCEWTLRSWTKTVARALLPDMASPLVTAPPSLPGLGNNLEL
jgi:hypothetical protein